MKSIPRVRIVPYLLIHLVILSTARPADWVARNGLSAQEFQAEQDQWRSQGLGLRCIAGYADGENGGHLRYAAVWDNNTLLTQRSSHGMTQTDFAVQADTNAGDHFRLKFINMYTVGNEVRYAAIWEPGNTPEIHLEELSGDEFESANHSLTALGYQLISMSSCNAPGENSQDLHSGVWAQSPPSGPLNELRFLQSTSQYQSEFNQLAGQGFRLVCLAPCSVDGEVRYSSIWRHTAGSRWRSYQDLKKEDYRAESENVVYQHWRTEYVSVHLRDGKPKFNAVWSENGGLAGECAELIDNGITSFMENNNTPGISLALMKDARLVFARGYGQSDHVSGNRAAPLDRYRIASISKPITAAAILQLTEETDLNLDDLVFGVGDTALGVEYGNGRYSEWEKQITIRQLLNHTSGWTRDDPLWNNAYGQDHDAIMDWSLDQNSPSSEPGSSYTYNNLNYHALARVIEKYAGASYEDYCRQTLLTRCGITTMELGKQRLEDRKEREVRYYDSQYDPYTVIDPERMDANGGWIATAVDLLLFLRRVDNLPFPGDILTTYSLDAMRTGSAAKANWGLGWTWNTNRTWEGHNGCMTGTSSFLVNREDGLAYAVLANKRTSCSWSLKSTIDTIMDELKAKDQWPEHDLFPLSAPYREWTSLHFPQALSSFNGIGFFSTIQPGADPDKDGLVNAAEKYFGTDPNLPDRQPLTIGIENEEAVIRWPNPQNSGHSVRVMLSADFHHWEASSYTVIRSTDDDGLPIDFMELHLPLNQSRKIYARLEIGEE